MFLLYLYHISPLILVLIFLLAAFFPQIKKAASDRRTKRIILGALAAVILCAGVWIWSTNRVIGVRSGEGRITMNDGTVYKESTDDPYTSRDWGRKLGRITDSYGAHWSVFAVRGDPNGEYIYVTFLYHGQHYRKIPQ